MFQMLKRTDSGFRATPGTALKNDQTGAMVYIPPQDANKIIARMNALEIFINDDAIGEDGRGARAQGARPAGQDGDHPSPVRKHPPLS